MLRWFLALTGMLLSTAGADRARADEQLLKLLDESGFFTLEDADNQELRESVLKYGIDAVGYSNRAFFVDAEKLAEGGFGELLREAEQHLVLRGVNITEIEESETDDGGHEAIVNGKKYVLYTGADLDRDDDSIWTKSGLALWQAITDNLPDDSNERFYLLYSANDLTGIFLNEPVYNYWIADQSVAPGSKPYIPNNIGRSPFMPDEPSWGWKAHEKALGNR